MVTLLSRARCRVACYTVGMATTTTCYLICFDERYAHAGHYLGSTSDLPGRLAEHASGRGARLMEVITQAGITWTLVRTWEGGRQRERRLKNQGGHGRMCPRCLNRWDLPGAVQPEPSGAVA